jgi:hypothetical protein
MKINIGIDPGKTGAIAYFLDDQFTLVEDIPTIKGKEVDIPQLRRLLSLEYLTGLFNHSSTPNVAIEDVHAIYGASAGATFTFGWICGLLEGILNSNSYPYVKVTPKEWQKKAWMGVPEIKKPGKNTKDSKAMSRLALNRLYPTISPTIPKTKDGRVDAILIGHWLL